MFLQHYGVKGMKWGVRRFQNKDGSLTNAGKIRYNNESSDHKDSKLHITDKQKKAIILGSIAVGAGLALYSGIKLHNINHNTVGLATLSSVPLKDDLNYFGANKADVKLPKGTIFQRISTEAIEDYQSRGHIYVSNMLHDNLVYRNKMPSVLNVDRPFIHRLKANTEVKAPSRRVAAEIYLQLHPEATQASYVNFMTNGIRENTNDSKNFINRLMKLGYNAIIDENDAGGRGIARQPLILLNPDISAIKTHKMSTMEKVLAMV